MGIRDFKKTHGDRRLDALEETLPHLLRAGLFSQKWLDVSLLGKTSLRDTNSGTTQGSTAQGISSSGGNFDLIVDGEILEVGEDRIRVDIVVTDKLRAIVFRDSVSMGTQEIVATTGQIADRVAATLREKVLAKTGDRLVAIVGPFESSITDPKLSFLDSSLPLKISESSEKSASRKNLVILPVIPDVPAATPGTWDIRITGKISLAGSSILISGTYQERTGLALPIEHSGPAAEPSKVVDEFSRKVWEVFAGRIAPAGGLRNDPVLLANSSPEKLFARGQEYEKSADGDAALFLYGMALWKKPDYVAARLRVAEIHRNREAYDLSEAQYRQVLAQSAQNAAAHLGLGLLQSKRGNYELAVQELERASSLAVSDPKLQFDAHMRLGDVYLLMKQPDADRSIQHFLNAAAIDAASPLPYLSLAKAYRAKSDLAGAIESLRKGLNLVPADKALKNDLASSLNALGKQQYDVKEHAKALQSYQEAIALDPPDVRLKTTAYLQAGIVLGWGLNDYTKAIISLQKAVELGPSQEVNHRALGMAYSEAQKYKEAIESLKKAIAIAPHFQSYWELGQIYRTTGEYDTGIEALKKAVQLDPENADGYTLLGALYESKFAKARDDKESFHLSEENLKLGIQRDAQNETALRVLGVLYYQGGQYEDAVTYLKQAIGVRPTVWSYSVLGEAYWKLKRTDEAVAALTEGLKLDRRYEAIYNDLDDIYSAAKQSEKFTDLLKETVRVQPDFVFAYIKLGIASRSQEKYEEAVGWLEKAIALDRDNEWAIRVMGFAYSDIGERDKADKAKSKAAYDTAVAFLNRAIRIKPTQWSHTQLGEIYSALGDDQKAMLNLEKAIEVDPRYEPAYTALEPIYNRKGRGEDFLQLVENATKKNPDLDWARAKLVERYLALGRYDEVIEHAAKAVELRPDDPKAYEQLASAQRSKGEFAKAYENIRKAIALNPQRQAAHITLANTLFDQKQYRQAITDFEALIKQQTKESSVLFALMGDAYRQDKSFPKAYEYARKAIALSPKYSYAHWVLGRTYADEEKFPEAIASAKDALGAWAEYASAQALLYQSCHRIKRDEEGLQFLEELLAKNPQSRQLLTSVGFVSHEYTREYEKAYEAFRKVYEQAPEDWSVIENFAEANLTTGRLDAVLELTKKVLSLKDASIQSKLSMRLFQVAAYLMRGEQGLAFSELGSFRDEYGKVPPDYARGWIYEGTKNYVDTQSKLRPAEKSLLFRMMDLLEAPQEQAAAKLKQFEASLAETFADLKAAASAAH